MLCLLLMIHAIKRRISDAPIWKHAPAPASASVSASAPAPASASVTTPALTNGKDKIKA